MTATTTAVANAAPVFVGKTNGVNGVNGVKAAAKDADVLEDYTGNYKFAPVHEAEVSRAMVKR